MRYAIVFGGVSYEHEISIVSAIALKKVLDFECEFIFCDEFREFYHVASEKMKAKVFSSKEYKKFPKLTLKKGGFFQKTLLGKKILNFDIAINLIHGADGEDGKLAALFEFFDIKYIGPRVEASVISFNKLFTKLYASYLDIKSIDYQVITRDNLDIKFKFPIILKPLRLGSSIGVSIVKNSDELQYALDVAFEFDDEVLIEPFIEGIKEYNLAGIKSNEFIFSIIEEPIKEEFLDFDKKYLNFSNTKMVNEANIDEELKQKLQNSFKKVYGSLFEGALIRCDFFVINGCVYLNEINPNPGSYSNYLFENFNDVLKQLSHNLPKSKNIPIEYGYIHSLNSAKGK